MLIRSTSCSFLPNTKLVEGILDRARNTFYRTQNYHDGAHVVIRLLCTNDESS